MKNLALATAAVVAMLALASAANAENEQQLMAGWSGNTLVVLANTANNTATYRCIGSINGFGGGNPVSAQFNTIVSPGGTNRHVAEFQFLSHGAFTSATLSQVSCNVEN